MFSSAVEKIGSFFKRKKSSCFYPLTFAKKLIPMMKIRLLLFVLVAQFLFIDVSAQKQFRALLVTTTRGWHHEALHAGVLAIQQMGVKNNFDVVLWEDPNGFTDKYLSQFNVVIFLHTTGN